MWGPVIPELTQALPGISIIDRTTVNAFDEPPFAKAVEATDQKLIIAAFHRSLSGFSAIYATELATMRMP